MKFQSTHPSWGATLFRRVTVKHDTISIHAPIVGCDIQRSKTENFERGFQSTHPSWGATLNGMKVSIDTMIFQSTHPSWGATLHMSMMDMIV